MREGRHPLALPDRYVLSFYTEGDHDIQVRVNGGSPIYINNFTTLGLGREWVTPLSQALCYMDGPPPWRAAA